MQKSLEETKEIIHQVEGYARQMLGIVKDFGKLDLVSMYLSDSHICFWSTLDDENETTIEGTLWADQSLKPGKFELRVNGKLVENGRDNERAVS